MDSRTLYTLAGICAGGIIISASLAKFLNWEGGYALVTIFLLGLMLFGMWGGAKYKNAKHPELAASVQSASQYDKRLFVAILIILVLMYISLQMYPTRGLFRVLSVGLLIVLSVGWFKTGNVLLRTRKAIMVQAKTDPASAKKNKMLVMSAVIGGLLFWYLVGGGMEYIAGLN